MQQCSGGRFFVRVMGGRAGDLYGRDHTGRYLDEFVNDVFYGHIRDDFEAALDLKKPVLSRIAIPVEERDFIEVFQGVFPCQKEKMHLLLVPVAPVVS